MCERKGEKRGAHLADGFLFYSGQAWSIHPLRVSEQLFEEGGGVAVEDILREAGHILRQTRGRVL